MSAKRNQVGIRLVALNGKAVERELKKFGAEGQAALDRIQKASKPARAGLKAVDSGVGELKTRMTGLANSAGPVGTACTAIGSPVPDVARRRRLCTTSDPFCSGICQRGSSGSGCVQTCPRGTANPR